MVELRKGEIMCTVIIFIDWLLLFLIPGGILLTNDFAKIVIIFRTPFFLSDFFGLNIQRLFRLVLKERKTLYFV